MSREATDMDAATPAPVGATGWRVAAPLAAVVLVGILLIYWETTTFTADFWYRRRDYGHGLLLVPISLFMIWHDRAALARRVPRPQPWAGALVLGAGLVWALAYAVEIQLGMQLALLGALGVALWTLLGTPVARRLAFPVGYLLLGIPVWSLLTPYLLDNTATASSQMLRAVGVPVYLEASYLSIPAGQFVVEEVCSGLRYLLATMSIAALFAYLNLRRVWLGVLFFLSCTALSIVLNWLRVTAIVWVGNATDMQHWLVKDHLGFGWTLFAVGLVPMFLFGIWLQRFDAAPATAPSAAPNAPAGARRFVTWGAVVLVLSAVGPALVAWSASRATVPQAVHLQAPAAAMPWRLVPGDGSAWGPRFVGADAEVRADYQRGETHVSLYLAYYARQREGAELVNELNALYDDRRWKREGEGTRDVALANGTILGVREIRLVRSSGAERIIWYWYRVGDAPTTSMLEAKLLQLRGRLTGAPSAALVAVSAPVEGGRSATRELLAAFLAAMAEPVTNVVERAAGP